MARKILIIISLLLLSAAKSYALDTPHDSTVPFNCSNCHDDNPESGWWNSNKVCLATCHGTSGSATLEQTHSSDTMLSTKYGTWDQKCVDCHNPHYQQQLRTYTDSSYLYTGVSTSLTTTTFTRTGAGWSTNQWAGYVLVPDVAYYKFQYRIQSNTADTLTLKNKNIIDMAYIQANKSFAIIYGKLVKEELSTGSKMTVRFFRPEGVNSFAGGTLRDGICEACHTKAAYHKKDGTGIAHNAATKCTTCHEHQYGFKAVCDDCHDNPPGALVGEIRPDLTTNSTTSGRHDTHVNTHKIKCEACHFDSVGTTGTTHNSGDHKITMGFNPFNGPYAGGNYEGQTGASYNATTTSPLTIVTNGSKKECSNIYCHGASMNPNGGTDITPIWDEAATGACGTCHGASATNPPTKGSHSKHAGTSTAQSSLACSVCHSDYTHVNTRMEWKFGSDNKVTSAKYKGAASGSDAMGSSYGTCTEVYCHSNANPVENQAPADSAYSFKNEANEFKTVTWGDTASMACDSCHRGKITDTNTMKSNGHYRLVGPNSAKKYACYFCHDDTVDQAGNIKNPSKHANFEKNVKMSAFSKIVGTGYGDPIYYGIDEVDVNKRHTCDNTYCHSDGTTYPEQIRKFAWTEGKTRCSTCHGHQPGTCSNGGCHDGTWRDGKFWEVITKWDKKLGDEWKEAVPMFPSQGAGLPRANSHPRHMGKDISCNTCHKDTLSDSCLSCHKPQKPEGEADDIKWSKCTSTDADDDCSTCHNGMEQIEHVNPIKHVNGEKNVHLKTGDFNELTKSCSNTDTSGCHGGAIPDPVWGGTSNIQCMKCHGSEAGDVDDFGGKNGRQARISTNEWFTTGHGRLTSSGPYTTLGNSAANFTGDNPCSYCHEPAVLHNDPENPFRLRKLKEYTARFDKECVYCHMLRTDSECKGCHVRTADGLFESIAPEVTDHGIMFRQKDGTWEEQFPMHVETSGCLSNIPNCHNDGTVQTDMHTFPSGAHRGHGEMDGTYTWSSGQLDDIKKQYIMMGVCLKCHEEDSHDECQQCHQGNDEKYKVGFDPDGSLGPMQFVKPSKAKASSVHFGYKHFDPALTIQTKGGKFCWDCHDPHGDGNLFMIQNKVATETDGTYGIPVCGSNCGQPAEIPEKRKDVVFTDNSKGAGAGAYARRAVDTSVFDGICNVCHTSDKIRHYTSDNGTSHNWKRKCTECHEHKFTSSHSGGSACNTCHGNKPVPSHTAFGLPRDCTKCHKGSINDTRLNIMGQMKTNSHHVQGVTVTNKQCYACHWEATDSGMVDNDYHQGYNLKTHAAVKGAAVDLVIWGKSTTRPTTTAGNLIQFTAASIGTSTERENVANVSKHCLGCHNTAQNDNTAIFNDCKTPRQYAWDGTSIDERYSNKGITTWGKYAASTNTAKKNMTKAYSAHGNATANAGGFVAANGLDGDISGVNTRAGTQNVQCYDCHNSHGSAVSGTTSSYVSFSGNKNGANLKETSKGFGGYADTYFAKQKGTSGGAVNPYSPGAGQCFDCHETPNAGDPDNYTPWGYLSTFGATEPIMGYKDTPRFGAGTKGSKTRYSYLKAVADNDTTMGGHLKRSLTSLSSTPEGSIDGLCSPCHDPHGVSPSLGGGMAYAVPLLKGTWLTSPYRQDVAPMTGDGYSGSSGFYNYYNNWSGSYVRPYPQKSNPQPTGAWKTDRNTFNTADLSNKASIPDSTYGRVNEDDSTFAGLCLNCHPKSAIDPDTSSTWKSMDRVHESVKGWGSNGEHSFTCSKCHQPHVSGLPRLMTTNCLDSKHRGRGPSGGNPSAYDVTWSYENRYGRFPYGWWDNAYGAYSTAICHGSPTANGSGGWPNNQKWNDRTQW